MTSKRDCSVGKLDFILKTELFLYILITQEMQRVNIAVVEDFLRSTRSVVLDGIASKNTDLAKKNEFNMVHSKKLFISSLHKYRCSYLNPHF